MRSASLRLWFVTGFVASVSACSAGTGRTPADGAGATRGAGTLEIRYAKSGASLEGQGLVLFIDGRPHGPIPARFHDVPAGTHELELREDGGYYRRFTTKLEMEPEGTVELRPRLSVEKGLVTLQLAEDAVGAAIYILRGNERRHVHVPLPIAVAIQLDAHHSVVAESKTGIERIFPIDFSDGIAKKTITITFDEKAAPKGSPQTSGAPP